LLLAQSTHLLICLLAYLLNFSSHHKTTSAQTKQDRIHRKISTMTLKVVYKFPSNFVSSLSDECLSRGLKTIHFTWHVSTHL